MYEVEQTIWLEPIEWEVTLVELDQSQSDHIQVNITQTRIDQAQMSDLNQHWVK